MCPFFKDYLHSQNWEFSGVNKDTNALETPVHYEISLYFAMQKKVKIANLFMLCFNIII